MIMLNKKLPMPDFLRQIIKLFPNIKFEAGENFYWSPKNKIVFYKTDAEEPKLAKWALLHEIGHALLNHNSYTTDFSLLRMEAEAWQVAKQIGTKLNISIPDNHIQDCLDSYRDWIYKRSICPKCNTKSFQHQIHCYRCYNCHSTWKVTASRFCRVYRLSKSIKQLNSI